MGARGRTSQAQFEIVSPRIEVTAERPEPPSRLSEEEKKIWFDTVDSLPSTWFKDENIVLLEQYCSMSSEVRRLAIQRKSLSGDKRMKILTLEVKMTEIIMKMTTRMRINQISTVPRVKAKEKGIDKKREETVWETPQDD